MLSFKERTVAITGLVYDKDKFGPIMIEKSYDMITLLDDYYERHCYENEYGSITKIESKDNYNLKVLSYIELEIIDRVIKKLKNKNVSEISELSHEEEGYKKTKMHEAIPFEYAMNLKLF
ncbi:MAG: SocA family protein [Clostridia bacterium]|nr:SocA family protein [Clostridia bacterium]